MRYLAFIILVLFCGCTNEPSNPQQQVLRLNIFTEPPTLDPGKVADVFSWNLITMLFEGLTRISPEGAIVPALAEKIEVSEDGKQYTFYLRKSFWTDGTPVTAEDFLYAWKRVLEPTFPANFAYHFYLIKNAQKIKQGMLPIDELGVYAPDKNTFIVELEHPAPYFLELVANLPCFKPVSKKVVSADKSWALEAGPNFVSNGPFKLEAWQHHNWIQVVKNSSYWDAGSVHLSAIEMSMVENVNTELHLFENGELDWAGSPVSNELPSDAIPTLIESGRLKTQPIASVYLYHFNTERFPFQNAKMRKAFALAIDRENIVKYVMQGGERSALSVMPSSMVLQKEGYYSDKAISEARKLFKEALAELKITKEDLEPISLSYNTHDSHHKIAQTIQQQWNRAFNISVKLENQEWKTYLDSLTHHDFQISRLSIVAAFNDPMTFLNRYKYKNADINYSQWENEEYIHLLDKADQTVDLKKRKGLLQEAEALLMNEMPFAPIFFLNNRYLVNPELSGYVLYPNGNIDFRYATF